MPIRVNARVDLLHPQSPEILLLLGMELLLLLLLLLMELLLLQELRVKELLVLLLLLELLLLELLLLMLGQRRRRRPRPSREQLRLNLGQRHDPPGRDGLAAVRRPAADRRAPAADDPGRRGVEAGGWGSVTRRGTGRGMEWPKVPPSRSGPAGEAAAVVGRRKWTEGRRGV
jgi:hypothetical protein